MDPKEVNKENVKKAVESMISNKGKFEGGVKVLGHEQKHIEDVILSDPTLIQFMPSDYKTLTSINYKNLPTYNTKLKNIQRPKISAPIVQQEVVRQQQISSSQRAAPDTKGAIDSINNRSQMYGVSANRTNERVDAPPQGAFQLPPSTQTNEQKMANILKEVKSIVGDNNPVVSQLAAALARPSQPVPTYPPAPTYQYQAPPTYQYQTAPPYQYQAAPTYQYQQPVYQAPVMEWGQAPTTQPSGPTPAQAAAKMFSSDKTAQKKFDSIIKSMIPYEMFVDEMRKKEINWTATVVNNKSYIEDINTIQRNLTKEDKVSHKKRAYNNCLNIIRKTTTMLLSRAEKCYDDIKNFHFKTHRSDIKNILEYLKEENIRVQNIDDEKQRKAASERPKKVYDQFNELQIKLKKDTDNYFAKIQSTIDEVEGVFYSKVASMEFNSEDKNKDVINEIDKKREKITYLRNKILSVYNLNYSMADLLFDHQFIILYIIKGLRIMFMYTALFLATRIFVPLYEVAVYDSKTAPPPLWKYLLIFLGFDIAFNVFLMMALYLLMYIFSSPDNTFPINKYLFIKYMTDYAMSMVLTLVLSYLVSGVIVNKKYFKYKYEGARAIRAFETVVFKIGAVMTLLPFFWVI